jgi:hypothetical protein
MNRARDCVRASHGSLSTELRRAAHAVRLVRLSFSGSRDRPVVRLPVLSTAPDSHLELRRARGTVPPDHRLHGEAPRVRGSLRRWLRNLQR